MMLLDSALGRSHSFKKKCLFIKYHHCYDCHYFKLQLSLTATFSYYSNDSEETLLMLLFTNLMKSSVSFFQRTKIK